ncbi:MAG: hypothetical protein M3237_24025 [Actinomycetota bacterium]|nr:hypothetical protein [Actinomycetota bacterium]
MAETPTELNRELRELAHQIETPAPSAQLTTAVLERVAAERFPERSVTRIALGRVGDWLRMRWRWAIGLLMALVCSGLVVSPVGAEVAEWFGFHGVIISTDPSEPTGSPEVPRAEGGMTLDQAAAVVDFRPRVPGRLGAPDDVSVSADRRLASMSWEAATPGAGLIRLDQFDAQLSPMFRKLAGRTRPVRVGAHEGLWFPGPHEVVVLDERGGDEPVAPRLAARTLIWAEGARTFRLEGDLTRAQAVLIAESVR